MSIGIVKLGRLSFRERFAIGLVRGSEGVHVAVDDRRLFSALREEARADGLVLRSPQTRYLGGDELQLLGVLAMLQRQRPELAFDAGPGLREALTACARRLNELGMMLDRRNFTRMPAPEVGGSKLNPRPLLVAHRTPGPPVPFKVPAWSSLQARAARFVAERGGAHSRALQEFGASRAVIHLMFKRGLLIRSRAGVYEASREAVLWLEQNGERLQCPPATSSPSRLPSRSSLRRAALLRATP